MCFTHWLSRLKLYNLQINLLIQRSREILRFGATYSNFNVKRTFLRHVFNLCPAFFSNKVPERFLVEYICFTLILLILILIVNIESLLILNPYGAFEFWDYPYARQCTFVTFNLTSWRPIVSYMFIQTNVSKLNTTVYFPTNVSKPVFSTLIAAYA